MPKRIKTLLVEYHPRGELSQTRRLRDYFTDLVAPKAELTRVDLAQDPPPILGGDAFMAYYKRAYLKEELSQDEQDLLRQADEYRDQLMNTEIVIISGPMHNFGPPAAIKAWLDLVMQRNYVYEVGEDGHIPRLQHLKVLIIYTAGITHDQIARNFAWNSIENSLVSLFTYMGAEEVRSANAQGLDMLTPEAVSYRIEMIAKSRLNELATDWYGIEHNLLTYSKLRNRITRIEQGKKVKVRDNG